MARPAKRKVPGSKAQGNKDGGNKPAGGRTTPKADAAADRHESSRYTAPVPKYQKVSPMWVPVLMFTLLGLGALVIFLNYVGLLPGATSNWYLLAGLGLILGSIITATNFH
jgi:hypothetical protein